MLAVLQRILNSSPGTFIDIGVNIGQTLIKVIGIDRNRSYIGFEPLIACCFNVEEFIQLNNLNNATLLPIALSDSNNILTFYSRGQFDVMASLISKTKVAETEPFTSHVQARIGDEVLAELKIKEISAIKIDVEGAEFQVLQGLKETLRTKRPPVIFEVLPNFYGLTERVMLPPSKCAKNQASADAIYNLFTNYQYDIYQINDTGEEIKINQFRLNDPDTYVGMNYIARPQI